MARSGLVVRIRIDGLDETIRAFNQLPKDANRELRAASVDIAKIFAVKVAEAARGHTDQSAILAPTVRPIFDRVPVVQIGGSRKVGRNRVPAYKVLFGAEFGSNSLAQFPPYNGEGYFFFQEFRQSQDEIGELWFAAADDILRAWAS